MTANPITTSTSAGTEAAADRLARRPWPTTPINRTINVSFEFFPPATQTGERNLARCADVLAPLGPRFVSVTYGAGGTTQSRTHDAVSRLARETDLSVAGHLTCVGATTEAVGRVVDDYLEAGVRHIVALRGDPPEGQTDGSVPGGYQTAAELVAGLRAHADRAGQALEISVGAYPEVHPRASSPEADLDNLKKKLDAGADRAITQFFFETETYLRFLERARAAGITQPIVPGIMPVTSFSGISRFAGRCGTTIPDWMNDLFAGLDDAPEVQQLVAATVAAEQCRSLAEHGITDFHFYTMNKPELTAATCHILGVRPQLSASAARPAETKRAS